ncbi:MAG: hypothetical protein V1869_02950 [Candidatus Omnitrophota bacterium]
MKTKIIILILSVIYASCLLTPVLNPIDSEYYYRKGQLTKAIEAEPAKAVYHMLYALDLIQQNPRPNALTRKLILTQLTQALELKPYSRNYRKIFDKYAPYLK